MRAAKELQYPQREPRIFTRRIGSTTYRLNVHFNEDNKESYDDKIMRLIRNESTGRRVVKKCI